MKINSTRYEQNETKYITEAGNYLMKLVRWEQDGYSQNGEMKIKVLMNAKKINDDGSLSDENYTNNYFMYDGEKAGFTIAMLRDALKSPDVFDLNDWIERFVNAKVEMELGNDGKSYARIKGFEYSKFNDKLPPIQEAKEEHSEPRSQSISQNNQSVDIPEDEIPF